MPLGNDRWSELTPSQFEHEAEGLAIVRKLLPDIAPYRAWSNFEFRDNHGRWHEVDLLVLGRRSLHLVELKYYSGVLRGDDHTWLRAGKRAEDSPLKLARRKAQYLASRLRDEFAAWARERKIPVPDLREGVPFVQESVFLHHKNLVCELSEHSAQGLYGLDHWESRTHLPGISRLLTESPRERQVIKDSHDKLLPILMERLGLVERRERTAGSWVIEESMLSEGEGTQERRAYHRVTPTTHARIRFQAPPPGATAEAERELAKVAQHEFRTMTRLVHDGLLRPLDIVASDGLGTGLVYPFDESLQRLDHWLAAQEQGIPLQTQLTLIRQITEAVHYAHGSAVAHRSLSPHAIWVRTNSDGSVKALVGDWQSSGTASTTPGTGLPTEGVTRLYAAAHPTDEVAQEFVGFGAPEGAWQASASDRYRLDVFGVGALAFYLLTGAPPAASQAALRDRLREQGGLDISPELPGASEPLRELVLRATSPAPGDRTPDLAEFLEQLARAERAPEAPAEPGTDPLEVTPGTVLEDRFRLERRLGQGSTAVGLLVTDLAAEHQPERVLKVALHDKAARRLADEADVLGRLSSPRLVKLIEGPIEVGTRQALLLESAGAQTLAEVLQERQRLSLDLLQRYGTDLLEALVALDKAGVDHRDIKPANLGVRTSRSGDRAKHLVLFDFSLTRAAAAATEAGTPPYLDPFLIGDRDSYDTAAERYAAAVVLFEMATGQTPVYGDPSAHPAVVEDDVTIEHSAFDASIAKPMAAFFAHALSRDAAKRPHTAAEMLQAWEAAFPDSATTVPDNADKLADAATLATPLAKSGLSARALSAIEPLEVATVGDLANLDPVRLNKFTGAADVTRREVKSRARQWRTKFADALKGTGSPTSGGSLPTPQDAADLLMRHTGKGNSPARAAMARLIMGVGTDLDAFATQAQLAAHLPTPVTPARATQLIGTLQDGWADTPRALHLLTTVDLVVRDRVAELGGVATIEELTAHLLAEMAPRGIPAHAAERDEQRLVQGVLRAVLDRQRALARAEAGMETLHTRRRDGRMSLVASDPALIEAAEMLGRETDRLVAQGTGTAHEEIVPADLAMQHLRAALDGVDAPPEELLQSGRLARLGAGLSTRAAASGAGELHHRDLPVAAAVSHALRGIGAHRGLSPRALKGRVAARFPALSPLPDRPALDQVVASADIGLVYDTGLSAYRPLEAHGDTTGLQSRRETRVVVESTPVVTAGVAGQRLRDSRARRSFLALGVPGHRLDRAARVLVTEFGAHDVDLTDVLVQALREQADAAGMQWSTIQAADAAAPGTRPAQGLAALVARSAPAVTAAIEEAMAQASPGEQPVLLTGASTLARYGHLGVLTQWADLTHARSQAVWLVVPQLRGDRGPLIDGQPAPLNSPGQFVTLDSEWLAARADSPSPDPSTAGAAT